MIIIAHRGLWKDKADANTLDSIQRAMAHGLGIELDVRDCKGELVISHDIPNPDLEYPLFNTILSLVSGYKNSGFIMVDIKSCGLSMRLEDACQNNSHFLFMGMPLTEMLDFRDRGLPFLTRQSEYEPDPVLYDEAAGVWIDLFDSDSKLVEWTSKHLNNQKLVCIVSAELNQRDHFDQWKLIRDKMPYKDDRIMLCTDCIDEAITYFWR